MKLRLALGLLLLAWTPGTARALKVEKLHASFFPAGFAGANKEIDVTAGEALVRFEASASSAAKAAALRTIGASVLREFDPGWLHVRLPEGMPVSAGLSLLRSLPGVVSAAPDRVFRTMRVPNDPLVSSEYQLANIDAFAAWEYEVGFSSLVTIAVMDTGIEGTHPDLFSKFVSTSQFFDPDAFGAQHDDQPPTIACDHGTRVAGAAAASTNNGIGVAGVSWGAKLISLKIFNPADCTPDCGDTGLALGCSTNETTIAAAMNYATSNLQNKPGIGKVVLNMSLGGPGACGNQDSVLLTAVSSALNAGIVMVAATGNIAGGCSAVMSPANCAGVIPVGAVDSNNGVEGFSCRGPELAAAGVAAPGVNIVTTDIHGGTAGNATGTSFASPIVAGVASLILSARPTLTVNATTNQVQSILRQSAMSVGGMGLRAAPQGNATGAGIVNAFRAMRLTINGTLSSFDGDQRSIAFPNPFRPSEHGRVNITVPPSAQGANLSIKIYTVDGQLVRDLGAKLAWDGKNDQGTQVATGTYIFLVKTDSGSQRGRIALIR